MTEIDKTSDPNPFSGVVTAKDIYDTVNDTKALVQRSLDRQEALEKQHQELRSELDDVRDRVSKNEKWRYMMPITAVGAIVAAGGAVTPYLGG